MTEMQEPRSAVILMPMPPAMTAGPAAVWVTAAAWAKAAANHFGEACVVGNAGLYSPEEARHMASVRGLPARKFRSSRLTTWKVLVKDLRSAWTATRYAAVALRRLRGASISFVWQHHELWQWTGWMLARAHGVPWVLFVDAPIVWEARKWGVKRPLWGGILEQLAEKPQLRRADVIACVSDQVAEQVVALGAAPSRVVVTPCCADLDAFSPNVDGSAIRDAHGLRDRIVVGWIGSFRRFHGLDVLIDAYAQAKTSIPGLALMLVGDGSERAHLEQLVAQRRLGDVIFTGAVPHDSVAEHVNAFDIATVVDPGAHGFHYSPLKLSEYMACGRAVIAPRNDQVAGLIGGRDNAVLVDPGDAMQLSEQIKWLAGDPELRARVGQLNREHAEREGSWGRQLSKVLDVQELDRGNVHA